jgi:hypothetical protein
MVAFLAAMALATTVDGFAMRLAESFRASLQNSVCARWVETAPT